MRIAYIAPYQGPTLVERRPVVRNLSLGARAKIELIAELLLNSSHMVEIFSQGEVIEPELKRYPPFREEEAFNAKIPIHYGSALPLRFVNGLWSSRSTLQLFKARQKESAFDLVLIYNLKPPQVACAEYALNTLGVPVILEYEDDLFLPFGSRPPRFDTGQFQLIAARRLLRNVSGCIAGSHALLSQAREGVPKLFLPGVVGSTMASNGHDGRRNWVVFSGTHSPFQGLEQLVTAWKMAKLPNWQLHIAGHGQVTTALHELARNDPTIVFHGVLNRLDNARLLTTGRLTVVPYEVSVTQGFSFKTLECLGAGVHVISTPLTALEGLEPALK